MRTLVMFGLAAVALVLNPFFACSERGASFEYGLAEIEQALAGTWQATWTRGDASETVRFRIEPAAATERHGAREWVRAAAACSQRTLVKPAHACKDTTEVPLVLVALDGTTRKLTGHFMVPGTRFRSGVLDLRLDDISFNAGIAPDGTVEDARAHARTGDERAMQLTAALVHTR